MKENRVVNFGTFDSERYWRSNGLAKLPAMNDVQHNNILMTMDELLFTACNKGDVLLTRYSMDEAFKDYLESIGFEFINNNKDLIDINKSEQQKLSVEQLMLNEQNTQILKEVVQSTDNLAPFSVFDATEEVATLYGIEYDMPTINIINKVNSKVYSARIRDDLGLDDNIVINSSEQLKENGLQLLNDGSFLIKDEFGVSGKGNLLIETEGILNRVYKYIQKQEKKGLEVSFILEKYMDKETDFSTQFYIDKKGEYRLISVQKLINNGFAYGGSFTADQEFLDDLTERGYFELMETVAKQLYREGYYGDVCIDSMMLKDGKIVPIIEINARKSMSLIKHNLDKYLAKYNQEGTFTYISVSFNQYIEFKKILEWMDKADILFKPSRGYGIIPLSANALLINSRLFKDTANIKVFKGRFYISVVGKSADERDRVLKLFNEKLEEHGFKIM